MTAPYPERFRDRDRWILQHRTERTALDPHQPYAFLIEEERAASGDVVSVATILLTSRECPWRCLMCDRWKNTLTDAVQPAAIPAQINCALSRLLGADANRRDNGDAEPASACGGEAASSAFRRAQLHGKSSFTIAAAFSISAPYRRKITRPFPDRYSPLSGS